MQGLDDDVRYRVEGTEMTLSSRALQKRDLDIDLDGDFDSTLVVLERAEVESD